MNKTITEYTITFEDIDEEDFITEDKQEADAKIEELKDNGEFYKVYQYYAKDWVYNDETGDWEESDVDVYYTKGETEELEEGSEIPMYIDEYYPTRQEAKAAEKVLKQQGRKTKVERHGNEYIVWTSYEKVEEDINQEDKIEYNIYTISGGDGVYNSHKVDTVETEEQAIDRVSELEAETGSGAYYTKVVNGKELEEAKSSNNKYEIEYATPNYTGGNVYVYTGKLKDDNYFIADDGYFIADDDGNVSGFDVRIVDMDPNEVLEKDSDGISYTLVDDTQLQEQHLVKDLDEDDAIAFTVDLLEWILENKSDGNYQVDEIKAKLDDMYKMEEKKSNGIFDEKDVKSYITDIAKVVADVVSNSAKSANVEVPNKGKLMNNNSVIVYELPIKFTGDMVGLAEDIAKQLYSNLESGRVKEVKCVPTHTKNGQVLTLSIIGPDIVSEQKVKKTEAVDNVNVNETIRDLISQINKWFENNKIDKVVLYEETPNYGVVTINVLDKELYDKYSTTAYTPEDEQVFNQDGFGYEVIKYLENYLKELKMHSIKESESFDNNELVELSKQKIKKIESKLNEGKVTTMSGTYDVDEYDAISNKVKQAYKDFWEGKITPSDLEDIKKNSGFTAGELHSIQYLASMEKQKKEEATDITQKQEDEKEEIEQQEEIIDTTKELEEGIKKEIYQYAKQQGLDIEKLRKQGIELETLEETLDTVIGNMVSKSAIEYMDKTGKDITWDFEVSGNDIKIIWNEV